jgi:type 1 fimbria pilin
MNKLVTISAILGISFPIVACGETEEGKFESLSISQIKSELKDPDSAKITEISVTKCPADSKRAEKLQDNKYQLLFRAQVNAKNSYGGYAGKQGFHCEITKNDSARCYDHDESLSKFCKQWYVFESKN